MHRFMRLRSLFAALVVLFTTMYGPVLGAAAGIGGTAVASADSTNFCVGLFTPGYWKNYAKNGAPLLAALPYTLDFGATLPYGQAGAGANYTPTPDFAVSVLQLEGKYVLRSLLSAELNVANAGLANNSFPSLSTTLTIGQLLDQAYKDYGTIPTPSNGLLSSTPAIPAGFTQADQTLVAYLGNGGGEGASPTTCKLGPPMPPPPPPCTATSDVITGSYVDDAGKPILNQTVWLLQNGVVDTAVTGSNGGTGYAQTDSSNGTFSFAGLQPGTYVVREAIRNGYQATEATLNGVVQSPANTSDVTVTIQSTCDKENVGFTINSLPPCVSLISTSAFGTAPDGHQDISVTLQDTSGSGLASIVVTGFNATILSYTINSASPTTIPVNQAAPYTITLSSPTSVSVTVLAESTNGTDYPGWVFDTNAFGANSCHGN